MEMERWKEKKHTRGRKTRLDKSYIILSTCFFLLNRLFFVCLFVSGVAAATVRREEDWDLTVR